MSFDSIPRANRDLQIRLWQRLRVRVFQCVPGARAWLHTTVTSTRSVCRRLDASYEILNKSRPPTTSSLQVQRQVKRLVFKGTDKLWNVPCNLSCNVLACVVCLPNFPGTDKMLQLRTRKNYWNIFVANWRQQQPRPLALKSRTRTRSRIWRFLIIQGVRERLPLNCTTRSPITSEIQIRRVIFIEDSRQYSVTSRNVAPCVTRLSYCWVFFIET